MSALPAVLSVSLSTTSIIQDSSFYEEQGVAGMTTYTLFLLFLIKPLPLDILKLFAFSTKLCLAFSESSSESSFCWISFKVLNLLLLSFSWVFSSSSFFSLLREYLWKLYQLLFSFPYLYSFLLLEPPLSPLKVWKSPFPKLSHPFFLPLLL